MLGDNRTGNVRIYRQAKAGTLATSAACNDSDRVDGWSACRTAMATSSYPQLANRPWQPMALLSQ
jgi:hypothetical protein